MSVTKFMSVFFLLFFFIYMVSLNSPLFKSKLKDSTDIGISGPTCRNLDKPLSWFSRKPGWKGLWMFVGSVLWGYFFFYAFCLLVGCWGFLWWGFSIAWFCWVLRDGWWLSPSILFLSFPRQSHVPNAPEIPHCKDKKQAVSSLKKMWLS